MDRSEEIYQRIIEHGESSIDEFIHTRQSEELFLDFKRSATNGSGVRLDDKDRNNLAKAISGFGNSEGGVIVWGIDCRPDDVGADVAQTKFPLEEVNRFKSWIEGAISGCTIPPHSEVTNEAILIDGQSNGFLVTHVPISNYAPHQVIGDSRYYIRAGSSFSPTPHQVLMGMFGRRPQPRMILNITHSPASFGQGNIECDFGLLLRNAGNGIAKDIYLNVAIMSSPFKIKISPDSNQNWTGTCSFGYHTSIISNSEVRLPPGGMTQPLTIKILVNSPVNKGVKIKLEYGCSGSPLMKFEVENDRDSIVSILDEYTGKYETGGLDENDSMAFAGKLLNHD